MENHIPPVMAMKPPTTLQQALARGHRWLWLLESGEVTSLNAIATAEGVDRSYVTRLVNLTLLAPDIIAAILDDTLPPHLNLLNLAQDLPALWSEQRRRILAPRR